MKMPEKDPSWIGALLAFYSAHSTVINGFLVGFIVAFRRVVWGGGKLREGIGEGVVCGLVGVNIGPVISPMLIRAIDAIPWLNGALTEVAAGKVEIFISCFRWPDRRYIYCLASGVPTFLLTIFISCLIGLIDRKSVV